MTKTTGDICMGSGQFSFPASSRTRFATHQSSGESVQSVMLSLDGGSSSEMLIVQSPSWFILALLGKIGPRLPLRNSSPSSGMEEIKKSSDPG